MLVRSDFKKHRTEKKTKKKYQYWDKIAAAFKMLGFSFFVFFFVCFFELLNIHRGPLSLDFKKRKKKKEKSGAQVKDGVTRSGAGLFGR